MVESLGMREDGRDRRKAHGSYWWRPDRLDAVWWALIFMWGALVLIADTTSFSDDLDWWDGSGVFWTGAGVLALIGIPLRLGMTRYRSRVGWTLFWGTVFLSFGLGQLVGRAWYALSLMAIAGLILSGTSRRTGEKSTLREEIQSYETRTGTEVKCFGVMRCLNCPMSALDCPLARSWMRASDGSTTR
jgi:hypothetical protein